LQDYEVNDSNIVVVWKAKGLRQQSVYACYGSFVCSSLGLKT